MDIPLTEEQQIMVERVINLYKLPKPLAESIVRATIPDDFMWDDENQIEWDEYENEHDI